MLMKVCTRNKENTSQFLMAKVKLLFHFFLSTFDDVFTFQSYRDDKGPDMIRGKDRLSFL